MSRQDSIGDQLTRGLWAVMRARGRGTIKAVEQRLGWRPGALHDARYSRQGGLRVSELGAVLEALDLPPAAFFADLFGGGVSAADRFLADGGQLQKRVKLPDLGSPAQPDRFTAEDLEELDAARFENAREAVNRARRVAQRAARDGRRLDAAAAVARQASAHRVIGSLDHAQACLWWVLTTVPNGTVVAADAWLRAGSVISDRGDPGAAAEIAGRALFAHVGLGDTEGIGRALVSRSIFLRRAGDYGSAIGGHLAALELLHPEDTRNRWSAHQSLGVCFLAIGDIESAARQAKNAAAVGWRSSLATAHLVWLRARIASAANEFTRATELYRKALNCSVLPLVDQALMSTELCRVYLRHGRPVEAIEHARSMVALVPDRGNRIVSAALLDLVRSALAGELSLREVEAAIHRLESSKRAGKRSRPAHRH